MAVTLGVINKIKVHHATQHGLYVGDDEEQILLPKKYVLPTMAVGQEIEVFITMDSEDRPIATTQFPRAQAGEFALMVIKAVTAVGAFADWGLDKDLLIPFREQLHPLQVGEEIVVYVYVDDTDRMAGSTKIRHFLDSDTSELKQGQEVTVLFYDSNDKGIEAIVDGRYRGLVFWNQVFEDLSAGDVRRAWIAKVREDGKLDIVLNPPHFKAARDLHSQKILDVLKADGGFLPLNDSSSPEDINRVLGMSKKSFKKAVGGLFKEGILVIEESGIRKL